MPHPNSPAGFSDALTEAGGDESRLVIGFDSIYVLPAAARTSHDVVHVRDFMSAADWVDANSASPARDHSEAFYKAFARSKHVFVDPVAGCYRVSGVVVPIGTSLEGERKSVYNPLTLSDVIGSGSVISSIGSAPSLLWNSFTSMRGITFYGPGKFSDIDCLTSATGERIARLTIERCGFHKWRRGVGNEKYIGSTRVLMCDLSQNNAGISTLVDSVVGFSYINANGFGVASPPGANDNSFFANKVEFNTEFGYRFKDAGSNTIIGGVTDRNAKAGISVDNADVTVSGHVLRRNGSGLLGTDECAHVHIDGASSVLIMTGVKTKSGANDNGSGDVTPNYGVVVGSSGAASVVVGDCDLSGAVTQSVRYVAAPTLDRRSNNVEI